MAARNTPQRNPSTDNVLRAHPFNNLLQNVTSYGNYARGGTHRVRESSGSTYSARSPSHIGVLPSPTDRHGGA